MILVTLLTLTNRLKTLQMRKQVHKAKFHRRSRWIKGVFGWLTSVWDKTDSPAKEDEAITWKSFLLFALDWLGKCSVLMRKGVQISLARKELKTMTLCLYFVIECEVLNFWMSINSERKSMRAFITFHLTKSKFSVC